MGQGIVVGHNVVARLMRQAGLTGAMGGPKRRHRHEAPSIEDFGSCLEKGSSRWVTALTLVVVHSSVDIAIALPSQVRKKASTRRWSRRHEHMAR